MDQLVKDLREYSLHAVNEAKLFAFFSTAVQGSTTQFLELCYEQPIKGSKYTLKNHGNYITVAMRAMVFACKWFAQMMELLSQSASAAVRVSYSKPSRVATEVRQRLAPHTHSGLL